MFELPELFGSPYILPAIVVIVVLILVLVLLRMRAKRKMAAEAGDGEAGAKSRANRGPAYESGLEPAGKPDKHALRAAAQAQKAEAQAAAQAQKAEAQAARAAEKAAQPSKGRGRRAEADGAPADLDTGMDYLTDDLPEAEAAVFAAGGGAAAGLGAAATIDVADAGAVPPPPPWNDTPTPEATEALPEEDLYATPATEPRSHTGHKAQPAPRESVLPGSDPVRTVVTDILQGWGDLAVEDTNRLEVFRPERVLAAITTAELPKDLKSSEYARTRLTQLKRYAANLERGEEKVIIAPVSAHEFSGLAGERISADTAETGAAAQAAGIGANAAGLGAAGVGAAALATGASAGTFPYDRPTVAPAVASPADPPPTQTVDATPAAGTATTPGTAWEADVAEAHKSTETAIAVAAAAFWARSDAPPQPPVQPEPPAPTEPVQTEPVPTVKPSPLDVWATDQEQPPPPVAEKPVLQWEPVVPKADTPAAPSHDDFLTSLRGEISTAAGLMALPAGDRKEMLVFLKPGELAKVFAAATDSELKKSVIDALEDIGSSSALDVIHSCLDDPDPEVQIHALDAADRLLTAG